MEGSANEETIEDKIRGALGVNDDKCNITNRENCYTIEPRNSNKKLSIKQLDADILKHNLHFKNCSFKCEIYLIQKTLNGIIKFERCIFKKFVNLNYSKFKIISFRNTIFEDIAYFIGVTFERMVTFLRSHFKERAFFSHSTFHKRASFVEVIFDHNAYFDDVKFLGEADFRLSEFYVNAHFYKTNFQQYPNFLQAIFNGYINLTGTKLFDFDFEQFKSIIDGNDKNKTQASEEFRNIFKNIKNALIKDNNLLDASRFHKMELYAKELELEY